MSEPRGDLQPVEAAVTARAVAVPLEDVADLETLWLGLGGAGAFTLVAWADPEDERDVAFLGADGALHAASDLPGLRAYLGSGDAPPVEGATGWADVVADADALDLEPYEDNVSDLDALGPLIASTLDRDAAERLLAGQSLLVEIAARLRDEQTLRLLSDDEPLGRFLVGAVSDVAAASSAGLSRLADEDLDDLREAWAQVLQRLASRVVWVDG